MKANMKTELAQNCLVIFTTVVALLLAALLIGGTTALLTHRFTSMESAAQDIEKWSVANPSHPLAYQNSFSLEEFSEASGHEYSISESYDVVRSGNDNLNMLCFVEKDSRKETVTGYSFETGKLSGADNSCDT